MELKEGQIWRKEGQFGWIKILQIIDPEYPGYDEGLPGARIVYFPPQLKGIQCRGGKTFYVADTTVDGVIVPWEDQITHNRHLLGEWKRGASISEVVSPSSSL